MGGQGGRRATDLIRRLKPGKKAVPVGDLLTNSRALVNVSEARDSEQIAKLLPGSEVWVIEVSTAPLDGRGRVRARVQANMEEGHPA